MGIALTERIETLAGHDWMPGLDSSLVHKKSNHLFRDAPIELNTLTTPELVIQGTTVYRVISDHLGSVRAVVNTDDPTDVPVRLDYEAFGSVNGTGVGVVPQGFAGGLYDADTGLVRFGARDYDPVVGRWVSKDPVLFWGSVNLFVYTENDPINRVDFTGKYGTRGRAEEEAERRFPDEGPGGGIDGPGDAFRHCVASCWITQSYGSFIANILGRLNEAFGTGSGDASGVEMDLENNACGRDFGEDDDVDCSDKCYDAAIKGELTTLR